MNKAQIEAGVELLKRIEQAKGTRDSIATTINALEGNEYPFEVRVSSSLRNYVDASISKGSVYNLKVYLTLELATIKEEIGELQHELDTL